MKFGFSYTVEALNRLRISAMVNILGKQQIKSIFKISCLILLIWIKMAILLHSNNIQLEKQVILRNILSYRPTVRSFQISSEKVASVIVIDKDILYYVACSFLRRHLKQRTAEIISPEYRKGLVCTAVARNTAVP